MSIDVRQMVTDRIITELEKGNIPWKKPWISPNGSRNGVAYSRSTGKPYSLLNQWLLGIPGEWATYDQIQKDGGKVKKGEKSKMCVLWKVSEKEIENTETGEKEKKKFFVLRYFNVFHIPTQTEGIEPKYKEEELPKLNDDNSTNALDEILNAYYSKYSIVVNECISSKAFYSPTFDSITIPQKSQYANVSEYYSTKAHETIHSTGHKTRLNRLDNGVDSLFGGKEYSKEELVAEIGASALCNLYGLENNDSFTNSVAYIQSWISKLKNDKNFIISASTKAEKAINLILGNIGIVEDDETEEEVGE